MAVEYYCAACGKKIDVCSLYCHWTRCPHCLRRLSPEPIYVAIEEPADRVIFLPFLVKSLDIEGETFVVRKSVKVNGGYVLFLERRNLLQAEEESNADIQN